MPPSNPKLIYPLPAPLLSLHPPTSDPIPAPPSLCRGRKILPVSPPGAHPTPVMIPPEHGCDHTGADEHLSRNKQPPHTAETQFSPFPAGHYHRGTPGCHLWCVPASPHWGTGRQAAPALHIPVPNLASEHPKRGPSVCWAWSGGWLLLMDSPWMIMGVLGLLKSSR